MKRHHQLKLARIRAGLTQLQLATRAGVPENTISKLETGRIQPSAELFDALHRHLSLPTADIFAQEHWETSEIQRGER